MGSALIQNPSSAGMTESNILLFFGSETGVSKYEKQKPLTMRDYFYKRKLPHWQPPEGTFFITDRLYGSIPKPVIERLKSEYQAALHELEQEHSASLDLVARSMSIETRQTLEGVLHRKQYDAAKRHFQRFDDFLDSNLNEPHWLKDPALAKFNLENYHHYAGRYFTLWACCIMANHVHLLITLNPGAPILWKVMQDMKKYSGRKCNGLLGRSGSFWESESYDHLVREYSPGEFERILWYILNNPVKAGLVQAWQDWPFSYCHPDFC